MVELEKSIEDKNERKKLMDGLLGYILTSTQEAAVVPPHVALAVRPNPGFWEFVKVDSGDLSVDEINVTDYLKFKEMIFDENWYVLNNVTYIHMQRYSKFNQCVSPAFCRASDENALEIDFGAVDFTTPHLTLSSSIGNGVSYISKFISTRQTCDSQSGKTLVDYLVELNHRGEVIEISSEFGWIVLEIVFNTSNGDYDLFYSSLL